MNPKNACRWRQETIPQPIGSNPALQTRESAFSRHNDRRTWTLSVNQCLDGLDLVGVSTVTDAKPQRPTIRLPESTEMTGPPQGSQ